MYKKMKNIIPIFLVLLLSGCQDTDYDKAIKKVKNEMNWLNNANPNQDFEEAIKKKDYWFIGIYGAKLITPAVNINCLNYEKDINPIKGTSDAVLGYEHAKLIAIATAYAKHYNFKMKVYLGRNGKFKCNT